MKKNQTENLVIRRGRLVRDEHGLSIVDEQVLPPLVGSERAVRASVIKNASLQELEAANALEEAALARSMRIRRRSKPFGADV